MVTGGTTRLNWRKVNPDWLLWGLFLLLVAAGITGSSFGWFKSYPGANGVAGIVGERKLVGTYRGIRGDEFIAHGTPTALAQYHHQPPFPGKNENIGLAGRNFRMLHDLGAPVWDLSTLGRPATWGFFLFDLRRGLAWYWLFPIFCGIWSFRLLFDGLWPGQRGWNWLFSLGIVFSPYAAGWSFWPVNNAFGLSLAAAATLRLLREKRGWPCFGWGVLAGWGAAVSALSVYFPRIWPVACLLLLSMVAVMVRDSLFRRLREPAVWAALLAAAVVVAGLVGVWLIGAREEIRLVQEAAYPGMRRLSGGFMEWWEMMKGWLYPFTTYKLDFSNQSEMQSWLCFLLPLLLFYALHYRRLKRDPLPYALFGFLFFTLLYQHVGLPAWLARITLWDRCSPPRAGMALTMAQFLLIGCFIHHRKELPGLPPWRALGAALGSAVPGGLLLTGAPAALWQGIAVYFPQWLMGAIGGAMAGIYLGLAFLLFTSCRWFALAFTLLNLLPGLVFNPVCIAPERIENRLQPFLEEEGRGPYGGRFLFATGNNFLAVVYSASGGRVFNGYFMYEDPQIFNLLYRNLPNAAEFHRMNHLDADIVPPDRPPFAAGVPFNDRISLSFNGEKYDFSQLPIDFLAALPEAREWLRRNPSLTFRRTIDDVDYYRVRR